MRSTGSVQDDEKSSLDSDSRNDNTSVKQSTRTSGSNSDSNDENCKNAIRAKLSKEDTSSVNTTGTLVLIVLVCAAAAICVVIFFISKNAESEQFRSQYDGIADKVVGSFEMLSARMSALNSIGSAATVVGFNRTTNTTTWPFVTMPAFEQRAATVLSLSLAIEVSLHPIVTNKHRDEWESSFSPGQDKYWIKDGLDHQANVGLTNFEPNAPAMDEVLMTNYANIPIVDDVGNMIFVVSNASDPYFLPKWQTNPVLKKDRINVNLFNQQRTRANESNLDFRYDTVGYVANGTGFAEECVNTGRAVLSSFDTCPPGSIHDPNPYTARIATLKSMSMKEETQYAGTILAMLYLPIFDTFKSNRKVVGVLTAILFWRNYLEEILPENVKGIIAVIENTCDGFYTFEINGNATVPMGYGDLHDAKFDEYNRSTRFNHEVIVDGTKEGLQFDVNECVYSLYVYPSDTLLNTYQSSTPLLATFSVAMVFVFTICTFLVYNHLVERRQSMILNKAAHSTAIVSSLFPKQVRDRLLEDDQDEEKTKTGKFISGNRLKSYLDDKPTTKSGTQPIADLFPNATVMFADIAGFTAWSSTRGPESVFVLLQTIYEGFDKIAKRRHVFKVETIGDCYLAVAGVPSPQPKHALIMARFAWECREKMSELVKNLEVQLGPDCSDLKMRFGIHSGPVTAGVLRGDRARFQLFGDAVNTAARMESTGKPDMIQLSQATANLLVTEGKSHWLKQRDDIVVAKGKGRLVTFWLNRCVRQKNENSSTHTPSENAPSNSDGEGTEGGSNEVMSDCENMKRDRLVDWMVEILTEHLKKMVFKNQGKICDTKNSPPVVYVPSKETTCLDEFKEVITLCKNDGSTFLGTNTQFDPTILCDLRSYVSILARMYRANPFHNFEHACHVTLSVSKLLKRIVSPEISTEDAKVVNKNGVDELRSCLHNYTYGIFSDPLAQFAIVFAAIIHDVDHRGCSNTRLIVEEPLLGQRYRNKSVAEQNSIDIAWNLLMSDQFQQFRDRVFGTQVELLRFRQLLVNSVLATDIFDKDLNALRNIRWEKAFSIPQSSSSFKTESCPQTADIKATIVIEHIIQASDVSHSMQHWHIYQKWNKRLFNEMYLGFLNGRLGADPSKFWYQGELSFFDNYVIPLAKKLKECNVFGVSGDEYLDYADSNRSEWELRGESIVEEMLSDFMRHHNQHDHNKLDEIDSKDLVEIIEFESE